MILIWLAFILCAATIVICGTQLSRYGDVIAEKAGLGRAWVGLVLMATVTSLPELITGISSVTIAQAPDIAVGNVMGACVFNLAVIALLDLLHGPGPIFSKAEHGHILSAGFGIILMTLVSLSTLFGAGLPAPGHVGLYTPVIAGTYALGIRSVFLFNRRKIAGFVGEIAEEVRYGDLTMRAALARYAVFAAGIIAAATWLPVIGSALAIRTGLGESFVGTVLIASATTLPELTVSIAALRIGATDMAIGNLFGSNLFNLFILAVDDALYLPGPLLAAVSPNHAATGLMAILMTAVAILGLTYRLQKKTIFRVGWDAVALMSAFLANVYLQYALRRQG